MRLVEIRETAENSLCDFAQNVDADWTEVLGYAVERAGNIMSVIILQKMHQKVQPYPTSAYSMHIVTSPESFMKAP